jgi:hypothetical protein
MKNKAISILLSCLTTTLIYGQNLYVPGGFTSSGIGSSVVSGNVGIGVSNPGNKFQIGPNPTGYAGNDFVVSNSNGSLAIHNDISETFLYSSRPISIRHNGSYTFYAAVNGYVGIGVSNPGNKLQIGVNPAGYGGNDLVVSNANGSLAIHNDVSHTYLYANRDIAIRPGGLMAISANTSGNVGIGFSGPTNKLQIGSNPAGYSGNDFVVSNSNGSIAIHNDASETYFYSHRPISIRANGQYSLYAATNGNVGIGTTTPGSFKLAVEGKIGAREVNVTTSAWSDYVFKPDYQLRSLTEVDQYIKENQHLPDVPSEKEVLKNGQDLGEMNAILLKKIEELTLYMIHANERIQSLEDKLNNSSTQNKN